MQKQKICNFCFSNTKNDGRVQKQIRHAAGIFDVTVFGGGDWEPPFPNTRFIPLKTAWMSKSELRKNLARSIAGRLRPAFFEKAYWSHPHHVSTLQSIIDNGPFDLIHANDLETLPIACRAAKHMEARVLFDAHEYHPGQMKYSHGLNRLTKPAYISHLLRQYLPQTNAFVTVSSGVMKLYDQHFGYKPNIIFNAPERADIKSRPAKADCVRIVHHGGAKPSRRQEVFVEMMRHLDHRFQLTFMLMPDRDGYVNRLQKLAKEIPGDRISFCDPVPTDRITTAISEYDIGVHQLPPTCLNHIHAVPNKLLEYICAGLACVIGPSPDMAEIVKKNKIGIVASDHTPQALANAINCLTVDQINEMKRNSIVASKIYNADVEMKKLVQLYNEVLSEPPNGHA